MKVNPGLSVFLSAFAAFLQGAFAQKSYPGCDPLADSDFKITTLISRDAQNQLEEPVKMALDMDDQGSIDIYFVQRYGKIRKFAVASKQLTTIGTIPVDVKLEDGVTGIILDPGFKTNRWLYLYYATGTATDFKFHLSRFKLDGAGMLGMASERPILIIPAGKGKSHTGGSMRFDPQGVLYLGVGENEGGELSSANTNDLRGKILRIKPIAFPDAEKPAPGPGATYTIPTGNLFPTAANGGPGTAKTRPEIYIMGDRNPYTLSLDNQTGRLAWGELGPNGTDTTEEDNITKTPGNYGYPYYAGHQVVVTPNAGTPDKPLNNNPQNTGLKELPASIPATRAYLRSAAMTGPIYRYNDAPKSSAIKFPPHFEGLWFVTDFNSNEIDTIQLDASGTKMVSVGRVFKNLRLDAPLDFQQGPDGALYVVNYGGYFSSTAATALVRLEYSGSCRPAPVGTLADFKRARGARVVVIGFRLEVGDVGPFELQVLDLRGRVMAEFHGNGVARYDLRSALGGKAGVYALRLRTPGGSLSRTVVLSP